MTDTRARLDDNPNTCSHGYRFENGLCPTVGCGAGAGSLTTEIEVYRAQTDELLARYDARLAAVVDADREAAKAEMAADAERRAEYKAYLCSMIDHGCDCLALDFDRWAQVVVADDLRTDLQRTADHARDAVRRQPYPDRHVYALGWLASAVRLNSQAEARATADGVEQGIAARVPL